MQVQSNMRDLVLFICLKYNSFIRMDDSSLGNNLFHLRDVCTCVLIAFTWNQLKAVICV